MSGTVNDPTVTRLAALLRHLRSPEGAAAVDAALKGTGYEFDTSCPSGSFSAVDMRYLDSGPDVSVYATPGWDCGEDSLHGGVVPVPVQVTNEDGDAVAQASFDLPLSADPAADAHSYATLLATFVRLHKTKE